MHRIYSLASRVLIWLGEADAASNSAMDCLERITASPIQFFVRTDGVEKQCTVQELSDADLKLIVALRKRSWWTRVWTVQEGLVAKQRLAGCMWRSRCPLGKLYHGPGAPGFCDIHPRLNRRSLCVHSRFYTGLSHSSGFSNDTLEDPAYASYGRSASDHRDYVYGLLGLVKKPFYHLFELYYTRSPMWAFQQTVISITNTRRNLNFLLRIVNAYLNLGLIETSSWTYDFHRRLYFRNLEPSLEPILDCSYMYAEEKEEKCSLGTTGDEATTGRAYSGLKHDATRVTITLAGTVVGCVATTYCLELPLTESWRNCESQMHFYVDTLLKLLRTFTVAAVEAWCKHFSLEAANAKVDSGDAWRVARSISYSEIGSMVGRLRNAGTFLGYRCPAIRTVGK
jgi:hypothetical protein